MFDYESDRIIGTPIPVDFILDEDIAEILANECGAVFDKSCRYTLVTRNGEEFLCKVKDETKTLQDDDGKPYVDIRKNVLLEAHSLGVIKEKQIKEELNEPFNSDFFFNEQKVFRKELKFLGLTLCVVTGALVGLAICVMNWLIMTQ